MDCIRTENLTHHFRRQPPVLSGLELRVPTGSIYGFLGPNGAGKTTTLRLILGLLRIQQGRIEIFNQSLAKNRIGILKNIGSLIESPSVYAHLTARENLALLQKIYQCPKSRITELLELTGLSMTGKKKTGQFSLGMKQRLSIAIALLPNPNLLILDEPTNGLDPNGIIEIRELLRRLNAETGMTILVSSHLLPEIEKLVSHLGIIHKGQLLFQGSLNELHIKQQQASYTSFHTSDAAFTSEMLLARGLAALVSGDRVIIPLIEKELISKINEQLVMKRIAVYEIGQAKNDLESIFIDLVKSNE